MIAFHRLAIDGCLLVPLITKIMKLSTTLFFATAALATASELDNLGPEWEPVDIADGTEVANAHRALGGSTSSSRAERSAMVRTRAERSRSANILLMGSTR